MKSLFVKRRANSEQVKQQLALPPGFRKVFMAQKIEGTSEQMIRGGIGSAHPIQDTDPASATFGHFFFMVGYD